MQNETAILLTLTGLKGVSRHQLCQSLRDASPQELIEALNGQGLVKELEAAEEAVRAEIEMQACERQGVQLISFVDDDYPPMLREIHDPPLVLYVRGRLHPMDYNAVAMVGTRHPSTYGLETARRFAAHLAGMGLTVVSGLARGVDSAAHQGALDVGGRTLAVLGCGVDQVYPAENKRLYAMIMDAGALISEYPLGAPPRPYHFPRRNRIISGLSLGTLVVEAHVRSGSLITANQALEQGRDVFAVPGRADALLSRGTNGLIKSGAALTETAEDILEALRPALRLVRPTSDVEGLVRTEDSELMQQLCQPIGLEQLSLIMGRSIASLMTDLLRAELQGLVRRQPDGRYMAITPNE